MTPRHGYTALELLLVVGLLAVLASMGMPSLLTALRRGSVHDAVSAVQRAADQAHLLAKTRTPPANVVDYYGVTFITDSVPQAVAVTYGVNAGPATILLRADGTPLMRLDLPRTVVAYNGSAPLVAGGGAGGWMYQYRTGAAIMVASPVASPVDIAGLSLQTIDGRIRTAIAVYRVGLLGSADL